MASISAASVFQTKAAGYLSGLCKISKNHNVMQMALMKRLAYKESIPKPPPFPYWKRPCTPSSMRTDFTSLRFDDNSRLIIVDGPPAIGKSKTCQKLAEEFGMLYMPPPILDEIYINPYGYNLRELNPKLPPAVRSYDLNQFLADPNHMLTARMQYNYFVMRLEQYQNALLHLLASGQGVVLNGSIYSNIAYACAMHNAGYLLKDELTSFNQMFTLGLKHLLKPTLIIYLEASPEIVLQKIKQRGNPDEINSKVFTTKYLSDLNKESKNKYLSLLSKCSEILLYNWEGDGNVEDIVSDIERLNLDAGKGQTKFEDWYFWEVSDVINLLYTYQEKTYILDMAVSHTDPTLKCRFHVWSHDLDEINKVLDNTKEEKYSYGYNPYYGHKVLFSKSNLTTNYLTVVRRTPRDFINFDQIGRISYKSNVS